MSTTPQQIIRESAILRECVRAALMVLAVCAVLWLATGCATTRVASSGRLGESSVTLQNPYRGPVVERAGAGAWRVQSPPEVEFTGVTATATQIREWAAANGLRIAFTLPDSTYAQMEHESAVRAIFWLKRFLHDAGVDYEAELNDCEDFASRVQVYPSMFHARPIEEAAGVWVIYARMDEPFAGVTDGYHALCVAWTDRGVFVFEPQGLDLVAQNLLAWPNVQGITHGLGN